MPKAKAPKQGRPKTLSPAELSQRLADRRVSAESRGKWLEGALDLLLADPVLFGGLPMCQEEVLKRIFGTGYDVVAQSHPQPFDRGVQAVKFSVAKEFYRALASNSDPAAESLVMLWLDRTLGELANLPELVVIFESPQALAPERSSELAGPVILPQEAAPATPSSMGPDPLTAALVEWILKTNDKQPPAFGLELPIDMAVEREIATQAVSGEPLFPLRTPSVNSSVDQMAGMLVGVPGSGRSTLMKAIAQRWAKTWSDESSLAVYMSAPSFESYSLDPYGFVASQLVTSDVIPHSERKSLARTLERLDDDGRLVWLVDDMDDLPPPSQRAVVDRLDPSPAVIFAIRRERLPDLIGRLHHSHVGVFELTPLSSEAKHRMLSNLMLGGPTKIIDTGHEAAWLLEQVPDLTSLPLGVLAAYLQLAQYASSRVKIVHRAVTEWYRRAGLPEPAFSATQSETDLVGECLTELAVSMVRQTEASQEGGHYADLGVPSDAPIVQSIEQLGIVEPHPTEPGKYAFVNLDVFLYFASKLSVTGYASWPAKGSPTGLPPELPLGFASILKSILNCRPGWLITASRTDLGVRGGKAGL